MIGQHNLGGDKVKLRRKKTQLYDYSKADPFGSYTGRSQDQGKPVQDADDL